MSVCETGGLCLPPSAFRQEILDDTTSCTKCGFTCECFSRVCIVGARGRLAAEILGSNPSGGVDCLSVVSVLCCQAVTKSSHTRGVRKVSGHFEYLENRSRGLDVTWQPVRGDLTVHP